MAIIEGRVSGMRIERHQVSEEHLREAVEGFAVRIDADVDRQQHVEPGWEADGWEIIGNRFLDYAGARSVANPGIDKDTWTALRSAAEALLGAVELAALPPGEEVFVDISYTGTGVVHRGRSGEDAGVATGADWLRALHLWIITGEPQRRQVPLRRTAGDGFRFGQALMDVAFGDGERAASLLAEPSCGEERALRALVRDDRDAFWDEITAMLAEPPGQDPPARTLLPPAPLALTALAVRGKGWRQRIESDYLPAPLTGAADRFNQTLAGLTVVERPWSGDVTERVTAEDQATPRLVENAWASFVRVENLPRHLFSGAQRQLLRFRYRSVTDPQGNDRRQREALKLASQFAAAAFGITTASGDTTDITIGDRTAPMRTSPAPARRLSSASWNTAMALALLTGSTRRRQVLLDGEPDEQADGRLPEHRAYRLALRAYLNEEPTGRPMDEALAVRQEIKAVDPLFPGPPAVVLSRLAAGDQDGFVAALVEALEEHRGHFAAGRPDDPNGLIDIDVLALACHARRALGWEIPVTSAYLPAAIVRGEHLAPSTQNSPRT